MKTDRYAKKNFFTQLTPQKISVLFYFFLTHLLVFLIPLLSLFLICHLLFQELEDRLIQHNATAIHTGADTVDTMLVEMQKTLSLLQNHDAVLDFVQISSFEGPNKNTLEILSLIDDLNTIKNLNNNIIDIFLYSSQSDAVVTSTGLYLSSEFFCSEPFLQIEGIKTETIQDKLLMHANPYLLIPYQKIHLNGSLFNGYFYCATLPQNSGSHRTGTILICMKEDVFRQALQQIDVGDLGTIEVSGSNGLLYHQNTPQEGTEGYQTLSYQSQESGLLYSAYIPDETISSQMGLIRSIVFIVIACSLFACLAFSFFLSKSSARPIQDILRLFSSSTVYPYRFIPSYQKVMNQITGNIRHVISSSYEVEKRLEEQMPIVQSATLYSLLKGTYHSDEEMTHALTLSGLQLKGDWYGVIIFRLLNPANESFEDFVSRSETKILISDLAVRLNQNRFCSIQYCDLDFLDAAFLLSFHLEDLVDKNGQKIRNQNRTQNYMQDFVHDISCYLMEKYRLKTVWTLGEAVPDIKRVSISFDQAKQALLLLPDLPEKMYYSFNDMTKESEIFFYPFETEQRLSVSVKDGNMERVEEILQTVYLENFIKKQLGATVKISLFHALYTTLIRTGSDTSYTPDPHIFLMASIPASIDFDKVFQRIQEEYLCVSQIYQQKLKNAKNSFQQTILEYIVNNYQNSSFSLSDAATHFNLSESAFYRCFRENFQDTFAAYLENLRIGKAKSYLDESDLSVEKISSKVGYANIRSFQRAFKRVVGISPNDYRNQKMRNP